MKYGESLVFLWPNYPPWPPPYTVLNGLWAELCLWPRKTKHSEIFFWNESHFKSSVIVFQHNFQETESGEFNRFLVQAVSRCIALVQTEIPQQLYHGPGLLASTGFIVPRGWTLLTMAIIMTKSQWHSHSRHWRSLHYRCLFVWSSIVTASAVISNKAAAWDEEQGARINIKSSFAPDVWLERGLEEWFEWHWTHTCSLYIQKEVSARRKDKQETRLPTGRRSACLWLYK